MNESTLTRRGQITVPAALRKKMNLRAGQKLKFAPVSDHEFRVFTDNPRPPGPLAMLGYGRKLHPKARKTSQWVKTLREGET
jgi:AbrB family looped-hinge helix DNA binding protein